jgi:hypothetical protein
MVGGGVVALEEDFRPLHHLVRGYKSSECRTAIFTSIDEGDPFQSICYLGKEKGCAVWTIEINGERSEQNALDYIEVGIQNGDWVCLYHADNASDKVLRDIAILLTTLAPDPKKYPRRELFRLWLCLDRPMDINDRINPLFPMLLTQNAIVCRAGTPPGYAPPSPEKLQVKHPMEPELFEQEEKKRLRRREQGRDSDSESDREEPEQKLTGLWFHRAVDFHNADLGSKLSQASEEIFDAVLKDDATAVDQLCSSGQVNLSKAKRNGLSPLQIAVSEEKVNAARALLAAGADVKLRRASDDRPLLFMSIQNQELLKLLVDNGADVYEKYEGYSLEKHPDTDPEISVLVKKFKAEGQWPQ